MNKADIVAKVAEIGITERQAAQAVDIIVDAIKDALVASNVVTLTGFGTFSSSSSSSSSTGVKEIEAERIIIKAKKVPVIRTADDH